eukprot:10003097-Ditylum_brightwellii.AAC.2
MGQVDQSLYVQSGDGKAIWKTLGEIPTGAVFTTAFAIKQDTLIKGPTCVKVYVTLFSKLHLNIIKFANKVYSYIKPYNVFIHPDMFKRNGVVSLGAM